MASKKKKRKLMKKRVNVATLSRTIPDPKKPQTGFSRVLHPITNSRQFRKY